MLPRHSTELTWNTLAFVLHLSFIFQVFFALSAFQKLGKVGCVLE